EVSQSGSTIRWEDETFTLDDDGRMTAVTDGNGKTTSYGYDERGLLTSVTGAEGSSTTYEYDKDGHLAVSALEIENPDTTTEDIITERLYDPFDRLVTVLDGLSGGSPVPHTAYFYDRASDPAHIPRGIPRVP